MSTRYELPEPHYYVTVYQVRALRRWGWFITDARTGRSPVGPMRFTIGEAGTEEEAVRAAYHGVGIIWAEEYWRLHGPMRVEGD